MENAAPISGPIKFGTFEVDLRAGELRKSGVRLKLSGQPFQVLAILLESPGEVVSRDELQKRLWPDTFVDVDHNINTAINKIREVLGDSSENPRFVETLPRRGYRFIAPVELQTVNTNRDGSSKAPAFPPEQRLGSRSWIYAIPVALAVVLCAVIFFMYKTPRRRASVQRALTRITFDDGLQFGATWSPDGRYLAYSSDRGGRFDLWVQQVSGGDPVQITKAPGQNWQPDWSPDGKYIAYRSENGEGGLFVTPALGGEGLARKIASFGFHPRWSPDSSQILFDTQFTPLSADHRFFVVRLDGTPPREILSETIKRYTLQPLTAAWHPDGNRVSVWAWENFEVSTPENQETFWTVPLNGGAALMSEMLPQAREDLAKVSITTEAEFSIGGANFTWGPSAKFIYFDQSFRGARNIWRMTIDPNTLSATAIERMTAGAGPDGGATVSPDGTRLAFTAQSQHIRTQIFPFDANAGRITGSGHALTSPGMSAFEETLSQDGKKLAFCVVRAGKWELRERSLVDGREAPIVIDDDRRIYPKWSPDAQHLVYTRMKLNPPGGQIMMWSVETRTEEPITAVMASPPLVYDWSSDGKQLLIVQPSGDAKKSEVWQLSLSAAAHGELEPRKIISNPAYEIFQPHFSPDRRWLVFEATKPMPTALESSLYVAAADGGPWIRITDGKQWDDKPCWSPDGKSIYFLSRRGGFFNVWGIRFDPVHGKPVGQPFKITTLDRASLMCSAGYPARCPLHLAKKFSADRVGSVREYLDAGQCR